MHRSDIRISTSLATIEFKERKEGTQLVITEQGVFLDDFDDARGRERGTQILSITWNLRVIWWVCAGPEGAGAGLSPHGCPARRPSSFLETASN